MDKSAIKAVKIAIQNALPFYSAVLAPFFEIYPYWLVVFCAATGLYGVYMAYNQEEINEIVEFIKEHPEKFREEIVQSKEFEKGFLLFFEQYLKQRVEEKKQILKNIILGYALSDNKKDYELERFNDCLIRMTIPTLRFLVFTMKQILPVVEKELERELAQDTYQKSDLSVEWWFNDLLTKKSIWTPIEKWLHDGYSPSTDRVKEEYGLKRNDEWTQDLRTRAQNRERNKRNEISENIFELVTLGILRIVNSGATWGGAGGTDYSITAFGVKFLKLIDNMD